MNILQSKYTGYLVHITTWAVIFGIPLFVTAPNRPLMQGPEYVRFLLVTISFMVVFYTNYFRLIERHLFTRHPGRFLGCNLVLITVVIALLHLFSDSSCHRQTWSACVCPSTRGCMPCASLPATPSSTCSWWQ